MRGTAVVLLAGALACAGCAAGGGGTTGPSNATPPAPTSILTWVGTAKYAESRDAGPNGVGATSFEATVTWQRDDTPDPTIPLRPGDVKYRTALGQMHVAYKGTRIFTIPEPLTCTDEGGVDVSLGPNEAPPDSPELRSFLRLGEDGQYLGFIYKIATLTITRTCPNGYRGDLKPTEVRMDLSIQGSLTGDRRIQAAMTTNTVGEVTGTGSWDFGPR